MGDTAGRPAMEDRCVNGRWSRGLGSVLVLGAAFGVGPVQPAPPKPEGEMN